MRALTWAAYLLMACEGYLVYAIGFITPYLRQDLGVPAWVSALPNSAMAIGLLVGGVAAGTVSAWIGPRRAVRAWAGLMALAGVLMAIPVSILPVLAGGFAFGISLAGTLVHVNGALGVGPRGGTLLGRANLSSVAGGLVGPLVLSAAAAGAAWRLGLLVPVPLLAALMLVLPASPARDRPAARLEGGAGLPRMYWMTWAFLVLSIGGEFSFVVWGSQVVAARTEITEVDATRLASLYVLGMVVGRTALSAGLGRRWRPIGLLRACATVGVAGAVLTWLAVQPWVAGLGLLLGGLGISAIYPLGAALALAHAPGAPLRASARLTAASGVAILAAPLGLGLVASSQGVPGAWSIVIGLLGAAFLLVLRIPAPATPLDRHQVAATA